MTGLEFAMRLLGGPSPVFMMCMRCGGTAAAATAASKTFQFYTQPLAMFYHLITEFLEGEAVILQLGTVLSQLSSFCRHHDQFAVQSAVFHHRLLFQRSQPIRRLRLWLFGGVQFNLALRQLFAKLPVFGLQQFGGLLSGSPVSIRTRGGK